MHYHCPATPSHTDLRQRCGRSRITTNGPLPQDGQRRPKVFVAVSLNISPRKLGHCASMTPPNPTSAPQVRTSIRGTRPRELTRNRDRGAPGLRRSRGWAESIGRVTLGVGVWPVHHGRRILWWPTGGFQTLWNAARWDLGA